MLQISHGIAILFLCPLTVVCTLHAWALAGEGGAVRHLTSFKFLEKIEIGKRRKYTK
jgi:hypothetical protein